MKKRLASKATRKPRRTPAQKRGLYPRLVEFPRASGRTVERVELNLDSDYHCISIRFQDDTDLTLMIDPVLTFRAEYSKWKDGNQKVLKRWPPVTSVGI